MKLYLITHPETVINESLVINRLFENGLENLHLRKPEYTLEETEALLKNISTEYHDRISLHQHHELSSIYNITKLHFSENKRKGLTASGFFNQCDSQFTCSTSIHTPEDHINLPECFDYCFFGPVFKSISKPGYDPLINNDFHFDEKTKTKVIAIGGIDEKNCMMVKEKGFSGIALLGAIWLNNDPVEKFNQIKKLCQKNQFAY